MMSQPCARNSARSSTASVGLHARPAPSRSPRCARHRLRRRPRRAHRVEDLEREAHAVLERAAVLVGAQVGERREEAREQVAVRHVQLEQVEAGLVGAARGARTKSRDHRSMSARVISRGTWLCGKYGIGEGATIGQLPLGERLVVALPRSAASTPCGRRARAASRSSRCDCGRARSRRCASSARRARLVQSPVQPGVMRPSATDVGHLGDDEPGAADRARCRGARGASRRACRRPREYWHIGDTTTRFASSRSRKRNGVNIGGGAGVTAARRRRTAARGAAAANHRRRRARRTPGRARAGSRA